MDMHSECVYRPRLVCLYPQSGTSHARAQALCLRLGSDQDSGMSILGGSCMPDVLEMKPDRPDGDGGGE